MMLLQLSASLTFLVYDFLLSGNSTLCLLFDVLLCLVS